MSAKMARVLILGTGAVLGLYGWASYNPIAFVGVALIALAGVLQLTRHRGSR